MSHDPSNYLKDYEKILVAEQPGLTLSLAGIIGALFIGFLVQFVFSPQRIKPLVDQAAQKIHPDFQAHVEDVNISLADGIFPELAVIVSNLTLESTLPCYMAPALEVNQLKLPISFRHLLGGEVFIHEIQADQVSLSIRSEYKSCDRGRADLNQEATNVSGRQVAQAATGTKPQSIEEFRLTNLPSSKNTIDTVEIQSLRVHYLPIAFTSFEIQNFNVRLKSNNPKLLQIKGQVNLGGETLSGDYSSLAGLVLNYDESKKPDWDLNLNGNWREGNYLLKAQFDSQKAEISTDMEMKHIPLSQVFPLLKKYKLMNSDFNGKQVWLSLKTHLEGNLNQEQKPPLHFEYVRLEGNIGEIEVRNVELESYEPLKYKPIQIHIQSLNLNQLFTFLNRDHPTATLGNLGVFHGKALFKDANDIELVGEHSGLEFVFSSRGHRQNQAIGLIAGEMKYQKDHWKMKIDRIKPVEGIFLGDIQLQADRDWRHVQLRARVDDLTLGTQVQKLMTHGGEVGSLSGDLSFLFQEGELQSLQGQLQSSDLVVDSTRIKKAKMNIHTLDSEFLVEAQAQGVRIPLQSPVMTVFQPIQKDFGAIDEKTGMDIHQISSRMRTQHLKNFYWRDLVIQSAQGTVKSSGGWNEQGMLQGHLDFRSQGLHSQWILSGHRDRPQWERKEK